MTTNDDPVLLDQINEMRDELGDNLWDYWSACERWGTVYETPYRKIATLPLHLREVWRASFLKRGITPPEPENGKLTMKKKQFWELDF